MKHFFKKHGVLILLIAAIGLQFLYISNQERRYLDSDNQRVEENVFIALLTLVSALLVFMFIVWIKQGVKKKDILYGLVGIPGAGLGFYIFLHPFFLSGAYFINGLFILERVDRLNEVVFIDSKSRELTLLDLQTHQIVWNTKSLTTSTYQKLVLKDTVHLIYKKGVLGYCFDPKINL